MSFLNRLKVTASDSFSTEVEDIWIPHPTLGFPHEALISIKGTKIKWSVEPEYRNYGIKSLGVYVPDQEITVRGEADLDSGSEDFAKVLKISNVKVEYALSDEITSLSLEPKAIEFYNNKWQVTFKVG
jgi:hypothetical protein